nr:immunoglobulin light chain junction region [Macaca mulatta]
CLQGVAFPFTF